MRDCKFCRLSHSPNHQRTIIKEQFWCRSNHSCSDLIIHSSAHKWCHIGFPIKKSLLNFVDFLNSAFVLPKIVDQTKRSKANTLLYLFPWLWLFVVLLMMRDAGEESWKARFTTLIFALWRWRGIKSEWTGKEKGNVRLPWYSQQQTVQPLARSLPPLQLSVNVSRSNCAFMLFMILGLCLLNVSFMKILLWDYKFLKLSHAFFPSQNKWWLIVYRFFSLLFYVNWVCVADVFVLSYSLTLVFGFIRAKIRGFLTARSLM